MEKNYFLHRISHESNVSDSLLKQGFITIGWEKYANTRIIDAAKKEDYAEFNNITEEHGDNKSRSRWGIWYFANMREGDTIVVPQKNGLFSIYEVMKAAVPIYELKDKIDIKQCSKDSGFDLVWNEERLWNAENRKIDLGFAIEAKPIIESVPRKYAPGKFISRMKIRTVNANITDIKWFVEKAIEAGIKNTPVMLYESAIDKLINELKNKIIEIPDDIKFEQLIKWYLIKSGANNAWIPAKNQHGKSEGADADIIAEFENLKHIIYVQAKHHEGTTSEWSVEQIEKYREQMHDVTPDYSYATWVISSGDDFSNEARENASKYRVRLIDGKEFAKMLIDIGLLNIDDAFA